ncbi:MarR family winged helix-turn-helix transcriptional regulator [Conexibacter arvalis]|uniref:DNA-binding MarR family transcriptional regulator n=1 Tax=Conexibacter arvalis TaxID=912552 RepID=A0A840IIA8_9ACTN|nr:MarR family transcriptional regulator [Conexibacter arvalis]MBB4663774.1 DNA-binding MarR family transcriptional regulator [Conexibacter arvalis]
MATKAVSDAAAATREAEPLSTNLCWLLSRASFTLTTELMAQLERIGLSPRTHQVLIAAADGGRTQSDLVRAVGLDKTTMVVTVDELEQAGLAERRPSPTDRRARVIELTPAGRRKLREADAIIHLVHEDVLSTLPASDRETFLDALATLVGGRLAEPAATTQPVRRRARRGR